jgi:vanillate/3-O-methylgallate O-demethylase
MDAESLEELLQSVETPVDLFRNNDLVEDQYVFPDEYTNVIEEQHAVRESVAFVDQSYHMETLRIEGTDAVEFLSGLAVNSLEKLRTDDPPQAINLLTCNPDGYVIGDTILFYLAPNTFTSVGSPYENNWLRYNAGVDDRDVATTIEYTPFEDDPTPAKFRFQIQGPHAIDVVDRVLDSGDPGVSFFEMTTVEINGVDTYALGHGMAATPGLEIFGPYHAHDEIRESILTAGKEYGIRQLGSKAYKTGKIGSGWFVMSVPAIYEREDFREYREWLGTDTTEAQLSIGGSFVSNEITDYYMTPLERGQNHLVDLDHEFIGRGALEARQKKSQRNRVTLVWNPEDVVDVFASLFDDGEFYKFINLPDTANQWSKTHYDTILKDGQHIGFSKYPGYLSYTRDMLSLASIDPEHSDPGTEVTFIWGEDTEKQSVERHKQREIRATVARAPYVRGGRREM